MAEDSTTPKKLDPDFQPPKGATPTNTKKDDRKTTPDIDNKGDEDKEDQNTWRGGSDYPPSWTLYEKMSKETASYQKGAPFKNCGKCNYYQGGSCKIVRGYISQSMVCKYFSEKYAPMYITIATKR